MVGALGEGGARGDSGRLGGRAGGRSLSAPSTRRERAGHDRADEQRNRDEDHGARLRSPAPLLDLLNRRHRFLPGQPRKDGEERVEPRIAGPQRLFNTGQGPLLRDWQAHLFSPFRSPRATTPGAFLKRGNQVLTLAFSAPIRVRNHQDRARRVGSTCCAARAGGQGEPGPSCGWFPSGPGSLCRPPLAAWYWWADRRPVSYERRCVGTSGPVVAGSASYSSAGSVSGTVWAG